MITNRRKFGAAALAVCAAFPCAAQSPAPAPSGQKSLASTMSIYVFPQAGQAADVQSKDEAECYSWAVKNTGADPFELQKQSQQAQQQSQQAQAQAQQAGSGARAGGAVKGAAAGALIGEIANDDAGEGAAVGAAVGVVAGGRKKRQAQKQATAQAQQQEQQAQQSNAQQGENFKKAFSVCLEGKKYLVKY